jgi:hypothetical protein
MEPNSANDLFLSKGIKKKFIPIDVTLNVDKRFFFCLILFWVTNSIENLLDAGMNPHPRKIHIHKIMHSISRGQRNP